MTTMNFELTCLYKHVIQVAFQKYEYSGNIKVRVLRFLFPIACYFPKFVGTEWHISAHPLDIHVQ